VSSFSGLSIFDCRFGILWNVYLITERTSKPSTFSVRLQPFGRTWVFTSYIKTYTDVPLERVDSFSFHIFNWVVKFSTSIYQWVGISKLWYVNESYFYKPRSGKFYDPIKYMKTERVDPFQRHVCICLYIGSEHPCFNHTVLLINEVV
jgi:hypothetical protein